MTCDWKRRYITKKQMYLLLYNIFHYIEIDNTEKLDHYFAQVED